MLPTKQVLGILKDNLKRRSSVLPLSRSGATGWAEGLAIPRGGRTVLYTGLMYQLMPSMIALEKVMARFEDSPINRLIGLGRTVNRGFNASRLTSVMVNGEDRKRFDRILRNIVSLLREVGEDFGYLYEAEIYAGALAHDQGLCKAFEAQVLRVHTLFCEQGVKRVITVDPHTTNVLRSILPRMVQRGSLEVKSYLEILAERGMQSARALEGSAAIHDSCVYARQEGVIDEPRDLLRNAGVEVFEPEYSGRTTFCCGGPIESLFPGKAESIASTRLGQLEAVGKEVATMCPVCLVKLGGASAGKDIHVRDISDWLVGSHT